MTCQYCDSQVTLEVVVGPDRGDTKTNCTCQRGVSA